jgi:hypothetical protein
MNVAYKNEIVYSENNTVLSCYADTVASKLESSRTLYYTYISVLRNSMHDSGSVEGI